jgi:hypothetical protein
MKLKSVCKLLLFLSNFFGKFDVVGFVMKIDCSYYYYYYYYYY